MLMAVARANACLMGTPKWVKKGVAMAPPPMPKSPDFPPIKNPVNDIPKNPGSRRSFSNENMKIIFMPKSSVIKANMMVRVLE